MVEAELIQDIDKIEEEIIKESNGFVQKITSSDEEIVVRIVRFSGEIDKKINSYTSNDVLNEKEPLKTLLNIFVQDKEKLKYSFDEFDNGVIRVFETDDENLVEKLHHAADLLSKHIPSDIFLHENTVTRFILNSDKPVMIFFIYPDQEESKKIIDKMDDYVMGFDKVEVRAINVKESAEMDEIFKVGIETPVVVLYKLAGDEIKETAGLTATQVTEENIIKMANLE